ncbi:BZ3500_MvSof-1268-A1-R1_Chr1-3g01868 [Microbotryum saponariae]|uniref:BZ3500_MvSof-1268-A1-R1_Chr1-3g01868 protein n=1 Tax=Microbotryum saponariae TaxID=289078 RepID=A0A2X0KF85_9BASI|nr:BZ3500_MvSof-1268-A1-R1_Chr1-3g01868 [Microbotryum saponariae]
MSSPEPSAKRLKVDAPSMSTTTVTTDSVPGAAPAVRSTSTSTSTPFSFANEKGLFKLIEPSLGIRPALEPEVGITEYVDRDVPPFAAIIKHRFTDFMVFEVGLDGQVLRMKDIHGPKQEKAPKPPKLETRKVEPTPEDPQQLWTDRAESIITPLLDEAKLAEFKTFVLAGPAAPPGTPKPVFQSQIIESKEARTALHKGLREAFDSRFGSEMKELEGGQQVIQVAWMKKGGGGRGGVGGGDRRDRNARTAEGDLKAKLPPYIHFTLQKANKEMHDALSGLCRTLNLQSRDIGAAGTKDKRAVTVQRLSMKRGHRTIEDVWNAANGRGGRGGNRGRGRGRGGGGFGGSHAWGNMDRGVRIADVAYGEKMFTLGMLKGNRFVITLRDVVADSPTTIERAMSTLREHGFVNYYGMQRFGTAPVPTHAIGLALLRTDWALASHLILLHRQGEGDDVALARSLFHEGKLVEASRAMPRRAVAEKAMVDFYAKNGTTSHLGALSSIPKSLRMMYAHAWQSYIWNRVVSERVKMYGCKEPVAGDFVLAEGAKLKEDGGSRTSRRWLWLNRWIRFWTRVNDEPTPANTGLTAEQAAATARVPKIKLLTQEDLDAKTYTIFDVVLPMPGYAVTYPSGSLGETYRSIMLEDGIDPKNMFRRQREYSLGGTYRKIMHLPQDVSHRLMTYSSSTQDLAQSDEDLLLGKEAPVVTAYDPSQPMPEGHSLALQLEMTLGSSTYATMALREVLKTRTASAHQKTLTEAMEQREQKVSESTAAISAPAAQAEEVVPEAVAAVENVAMAS